MELLHRKGERSLVIYCPQPVTFPFTGFPSEPLDLPFFESLDFLPLKSLPFMSFDLLLDLPLPFLPASLDISLPFRPRPGCRSLLLLRVCSGLVAYLDSGV